MPKRGGQRLASALSFPVFVDVSDEDITERRARTCTVVYTGGADLQCWQGEQATEQLLGEQNRETELWRTKHSVPGRSRAPRCSSLSCCHRTVRSRRAGPVWTRIRPLQLRAIAGVEGPSGNRALPNERSAPKRSEPQACPEVSVPYPCPELLEEVFHHHDLGTEIGVCQPDHHESPSIGGDVVTPIDL
jgi:hypothetical protein